MNIYIKHRFLLLLPVLLGITFYVCADAAAGR